MKIKLVVPNMHTGQPLLVGGVDIPAIVRSIEVPLSRGCGTGRIASIGVFEWKRCEANLHVYELIEITQQPS